ncbi:RHS repeat-associated core domain-containing protein [Streptomyces sp. NPDC049687]|uniref:RHS repeat-associated core domain-containing protein n=1 Tax=Streptomyces sp. NPDC049687 TaxID=3365596 RepID=UPI0037A7AE05
MVAGHDPTYLPGGLWDEHGNYTRFSGENVKGSERTSKWGQKLVAVGNTYQLIRHDQTKIVFNTPPDGNNGLPAGWPASIKDETGMGVTFTLSNDLPVAMTDTAGRRLTLTYSGSHISKVTDPAGRSASYGYDASGNLVSVTDLGGNVTKYGYDSAHHLTSVTSPRGGVTKIAYGTVPFRGVAYTEVTSQTDPLGRVTKYSYTPQDTGDYCPNKYTTVTTPGGVSSTDYFRYCAIIQHKLGDNGWSYSYDPKLRGITKTVDPKNHTTTAVFDENGNATSVTNALGQVTRATYSDTNKTLSTTDPLGHTTTQTYDAKGNLVKTTRGAVTTSYTYGDANHPGDLTSTTDTEGKVWRYGYDAYGMQTSTTDPLGNVSREAFDSLGRQVSSTAPNSAVTKYTVDLMGRVNAVTDPLGRITRTAYDADGNVVKLTEPSGTVTTTSYDAADQPTTVTAGVGTGVARTSKTSYTADGNVLTQTDGLGKVTTYGYDSQGRVVSVTDPLGRRTTTTYDATNNPSTVVDPSGRTTTYTYDGLDRKVTTKFSDTTTNEVTATVYDAAGRRTSMTDGTGTTTYAYDDLDRLTSRKDGAGRTVGYGYDKRGLLTALTYPSGSKVTRGFDAAGRLTSVTDWLGHINRFGYDANSNLTTTTLGNGNVIRAAFDAADQNTVLSLNKGATVLKRLGYTRDTAGMITAEDSKAYAYDPTHRLTSAEGTALGYDAADRRTTTGATKFTYDVAGELTSSVTGSASTSYTYDPTGNRTKRTTPSATTAYGFDQAGQLTSLTNTGTHTFAYDGDGLRVSKYTGANNQTRAYSWNVVEGLPTIIADGSNSYITGPGGLPLEQINGTTAVYYFHDQIGSTRVLTNQDGTVNSTYEFTADGVTKSRTGTSDNPFQFAGQYLDSTTGLYYMRARYYDPETAQFISRDPAVTQTRQPYAYANDNPVNLSDPSGLFVPTPNGCGPAGGISSYVIPNNPLGYAFEGACNAHDFCYGAGMARSFCDTQFFNNTFNSCPDGAEGIECALIANGYYRAVHAGGADPWMNAQEERAKDLAWWIASCGGNAACIAKAQNDAAFDDIMNQMFACGDDQSCERAIGDSFHDQDGTEDGGVDGWISNDGGCGGIMCDGDLSGGDGSGGDGSGGDWSDGWGSSDWGGLDGAGGDWGGGGGGGSDTPWWSVSN